MKGFFATLVFLISVPATASVTSSSAFGSFNSHVYGSVSFTKGGFALGGDYEMGYHRTFGVGGYARIYSKDDTLSQHGMIAAGAFVRPHFHRGSWDVHFTGAMTIQSISAAKNTFSDETAIGPAIGWGMFYHLKDELSLGLEHLSHYGWFASKFKGLTMTDLAFKMRYSF